MSPIELKRGSTLKLEHAAGAAVRLEPSNGCRIEMRRRGETAAAPPSQDDDLCIDVSDDAAVARWADVLCCTPQDLRDAVQAAGPRMGQVKRHLFAALLREYFGRSRS